MNVVVNMLASNDRGYGVALFLMDRARALELSSLLFKAGLDGFWVTMLVVTFLNTDHVVGVLLRQDLTVTDWLHGCVIVVLMDLTVNGSGGLLMMLLSDVLIYNSGGNFLVDSGVMVTSLGPMTTAISTHQAEEKSQTRRGLLQRIQGNPPRHTGQT